MILFSINLQQLNFGLTLWNYIFRENKNPLQENENIFDPLIITTLTMWFQACQVWHHNVIWSVVKTCVSQQKGCTLSLYKLTLISLHAIIDWLSKKEPLEYENWYPCHIQDCRYKYRLWDFAMVMRVLST